MRKENNDEDLRDVMAEEGSRGKRKPIKAVTRERERRIREILRMLKDSQCTREEFLSAARDGLGLQEGSGRYRRLAKLWDDHHGS